MAEVIPRQEIIAAVGMGWHQTASAQLRRPPVSFRSHVHSVKIASTPRLLVKHVRCWEDSHGLETHNNSTPILHLIRGTHIFPPNDLRLAAWERRQQAPSAALLYKASSLQGVLGIDLSRFLRNETMKGSKCDEHTIIKIVYFPPTEASASANVPYPIGLRISWYKRKTCIPNIVPTPLDSPFTDSF